MRHLPLEWISQVFDAHVVIVVNRLKIAALIHSAWAIAMLYIVWTIFTVYAVIFLCSTPVHIDRVVPKIPT